MKNNTIVNKELKELHEKYAKLLNFKKRCFPYKECEHCSVTKSVFKYFFDNSKMLQDTLKHCDSLQDYQVFKDQNCDIFQRKCNASFKWLKDSGMYGYKIIDENWTPLDLHIHMTRQKYNNLCRIYNNPSPHIWH